MKIHSWGMVYMVYMGYMVYVGYMGYMGYMVYMVCNVHVTKTTAVFPQLYLTVF